VGVLSGAALAYEILLIRLFAIIEWHHLAFLVISLALLGYGASGTLLALLRDRVLKAFTSTAASGASAIGAMAVGVFGRGRMDRFWRSSEHAPKLFLLSVVRGSVLLCVTSPGADAVRRIASSTADLSGGYSAAAITGSFCYHRLRYQVVASAGFGSGALLAHEPSCAADRRRDAGRQPRWRPPLSSIRVSQYKGNQSFPSARQRRSAPLHSSQSWRPGAVPVRAGPEPRLRGRGP
jgi:hypothetical protein